MSPDRLIISVLDKANVFDPKKIKHRDIVDVDVGRAGCDISLDERLLEARLQRISWDWDNESPLELIGILIESCKDLAEECDGTRLVERVRVKISSQKQSNFVIE